MDLFGVDRLYGSDFDWGDLERWGQGAYRLTGFPRAGGSSGLDFGNLMSGLSGLRLTTSGRPGTWYQGGPDTAVAASEWLYRTVLGKGPGQMASDLAAARSSPTWHYPQSNIAAVYARPDQLDKALHAYAAYLAQQRYGTIPAALLGLGKEGLDLLIGEASRDDLVANLVGILLGQATPR